MKRPEWVAEELWATPVDEASQIAKVIDAIQLPAVASPPPHLTLRDPRFDVVHLAIAAERHADKVLMHDGAGRITGDLEAVEIVALRNPPVDPFEEGTSVFLELGATVDDAIRCNGLEVICPERHQCGEILFLKSPHIPDVPFSQLAANKLAPNERCIHRGFAYRRRHSRSRAARRPERGKNEVQAH